MTSIFCAAALKSQLLNEQDLEEAVRLLRAEDASQSNTAVKISDEKLAAQLVAMGRISKWQGEHLRRGRIDFSLDDEYILIDFIGRGGMGNVFKAKHRLMDRVVAVKVMDRERLDNQEARERFAAEIKNFGAVNHPNLVHAYGAREIDIDGQKQTAVIMEFLDGPELRKIVRSSGKMKQQDAAKVICDVAAGLDYVHEQGFLHRDIKPGNIMITSKGKAKMVDFGLAGVIEQKDDKQCFIQNDPKRGRLVGTADYLAPEVIEGHTATPASDIYSLGCTLYYMVTKRVPFPGGSAVEKCRRHLDEQPLDPRKPPLHAEVTQEFLEVLGAMMAKDPQKRIQTATEVIRRLSPFCGEHLSPMVSSEVGSLPGGPQSDTDRFLSESQVTTPVPLAGDQTEAGKSLWSPITDWVGTMSEGQFFFLVAGFGLLIFVLMLLLVVLVS